MIDQVETQRLAALGVVRPAGDLNQAAPAIFPAITSHGIAQVFAPLLPALGSGRPPDLTDIAQLARLMADLSNECGGALRAHDLVMLHRGVESGNKNARLGAGVREDLQQLLLSDGHNCTPVEVEISTQGLPPNQSGEEHASFFIEDRFDSCTLARKK